MIKSFFSGLYLFFVGVTILVLFSIDVSPDHHWIFTFLPLFIPVMLVMHMVCVILWLFRKRFLFAFCSLIMILLGFKFILRTFAMHHQDQREGKLKVFSYNVRVFNSYASYNRDGKAAEKIIRFVSDYDADVKCFQEFYYKEISDIKGNPRLFNTIKKLRKDNPYHYFKPSAIVLKQHFGLAIFSKYPIIKRGEVTFPKTTFNQAIYADILAGKDTIRVYNIHLQSMSIDENELPSRDSEKNSTKVYNLLKRIKRGAHYRAGQINSLITHMKRCSHKIILCGDLNDTPYSYSYEELKEELLNAFEEKGDGFGFTYHGKLFFLRIDDIFYDKRMNIQSFKTLNTIRYSDHFPLVATFSY